MNRRSFLKIGTGTALGAALGAGMLGRLARGAPKRGRARACILIYAFGGPSQIDTFDPKPKLDGAPEAIATAVDGIRVARHLPGLARRMKQLALVRSLSSKEGNHLRARHLMHTGYVPAGGVEHPAFGSLVAAESARGPLPGYVSINGAGAPAGFLGSRHAPFAVGDPRRPIQNLDPPGRVDADRAAERMRLWRELDDEFAAAHPGSAVVANQREVTEAAWDLMNAAAAVAFDLESETAATRERYGDHKLGLGCLMARRLVEAGVPFVEVVHGGWDTHEDNAARTAALGGELDRALSALLDDLAAAGLLEETLILWTGDFGRTPTLSARGGRDHYPAIIPAVLAGGGVRGGQVIGETSADGAAITDRRLAVPDLFATLAAALGLDPDHERRSRAGRPIATVDGGDPIAGLLG